MGAALAAFGAKVVAALGGKLALLVGGPAVAVGIAVAFPLVRRKWGDFIGGQARAALEKALNPNTEDIVEKELIEDAVLALVRLAEYKLPNKGAGGERFALAAAWLTNLIPILKGQEGHITALIEEAVVRMDSEALKVIERKKKS